MDWFSSPPALRAVLIAAGVFLAVLGGLWPLLRGAPGLARSGVVALGSVPAGLLSAGLLGLAGLVGLLHPWPPLLAAATGLGPIALMLLVGVGLPAIRARMGGPADPTLPPPPLPATPGRLPPPGRVPPLGAPPPAQSPDRSPDRSPDLSPPEQSP
jgi:hypothetical protein